MIIKQHSFAKVPINNLKNVDEYYIITESNDKNAEENPVDILYTRWGYNEDEKYKYFEPGKKTGTVKLVGKFEKNDGTVYEDTMTVTVEENNNPTVLALENAYTYFGLLDTDGKSVDTNGDGQIDEKEIKNVKQMNLYEATNAGILSGSINSLHFSITPIPSISESIRSITTRSGFNFIISSNVSTPLSLTDITLYFPDNSFFNCSASSG